MPVWIWAILPKMAEGGDAGVTDGKQRQKLAERTHGLANRPQKVAFTWREIEVPVIAAAQGLRWVAGFSCLCLPICAMPRRVRNFP